MYRYATEVRELVDLHIRPALQMLYAQAKHGSCQIEKEGDTECLFQALESGYNARRMHSNLNIPAGSYSTNGQIFHP